MPTRGEDKTPVESTQTVLVVDDDASVRELAAQYLRDRGLQVTEATDGLDALLKFREAPADAIVLDLLMPRLGGLRTLQWIRRVDQDVPVVIITGAVESGLRRQVEACGVSAVLPKPLDLEDLWTTLGGTPDGTLELPVAHRTGAASVPAPVGKVLVVDDEEGICGLLEQFLADEGHQTRSVSNGASALSEIVKDPPDVVLLDINMPQLGGLEALTAIHAITPTVKVIMISGMGSFELARQTLAYGAFDYVAKPPDLTHLAQTVQAALLMKELETETSAVR